MTNEPDTSEDHLFIDLGPEDQWVTDELREALGNVTQALYEADAVTDSITVMARRLPGDELDITTDYGLVHLKDAGLQE